jgi:putative ABC transport system substrate-binding protein
MGGLRPFVESGGLASYGPDILGEYRKAATYVDRILKGARPADLPVVQTDKIELCINRTTAKKLDLPLASGLLLRADFVVD